MEFHSDSGVTHVEAEDIYTISFEPCGDQVLSGWITAKTPDNGSYKSEAERLAIATLLHDDYVIPLEVRLYDGEGNVVYSDIVEYVFAAN